MDFSVVARLGEVLASEEGEGSMVNPYLIGGFGFLTLVVLLVITVMINVDR